jgi:hypothetical protein
MVFAFGALAGVVSADPEGFLNRLGCELMKGLAKELGTEVAPAAKRYFVPVSCDFVDRSCSKGNTKPI